MGYPLSRALAHAGNFITSLADGLPSRSSVWLVGVALSVALLASVVLYLAPW